MMANWALVEVIYVLDVLIFGYLFYYFYNAFRQSEKDSKKVMLAMTMLTGVLFLQEMYFGLNTATDPNKLALFGTTAFPVINDMWVYAKVLLTFAGIGIIYTLSKL